MGLALGDLLEIRKKSSWVGIRLKPDYNQDVARKRNPRDLSINELRRLLIEKQRAGRQERINRFRETGRVVRLVSDQEESTWDDLRTSYPPGDGPPDPEEIRDQKSKKAVDGVLLAVEVLAVLGLIFVLFNGLDILQQLNREVALALEQPTLTPTPLIKAVVLPSGHTPPNSPGGSKPNIQEIPSHLQPVVQSYWEIPPPIRLIIRLSPSTWLMRGRSFWPQYWAVKIAEPLVIPKKSRVTRKKTWLAIPTAATEASPS